VPNKTSLAAGQKLPRRDVGTLSVPETGSERARTRGSGAWWCGLARPLAPSEAGPPRGERLGASEQWEVAVEVPRVLAGGQVPGPLARGRHVAGFIWGVGSGWTGGRALAVAGS
jgi:hypothetical protein